MRHYPIKLPLFLTLVRLFVSPLVLPFLLVYLLPMNSLLINSLLAIFFVGLALTDLFDGYLARKYQQVTTVGAVLDPIADKCLVMATSIALVAVNKIYFLWPVLFLGREFFVLGLRQIALEYGFTVAVNWVGKVKTVMQMVFLVIAITNPYVLFEPLTAEAHHWNNAQTSTLIIALFFTLYSAYEYAKLFGYRFMYHTNRLQKDVAFQDKACEDTASETEVVENENDF